VCPVERTVKVYPEFMSYGRDSNIY